MRYSKTMTKEACIQARALLGNHKPEGLNAEILDGMLSGAPAHVQARTRGVPIKIVYEARRRWSVILGVLCGGVVWEKKA